MPLKAVKFRSLMVLALIAASALAASPATILAAQAAAQQPAAQQPAAQQPAAQQSAAPALPKGLERVATVEGITEYRLANGLRVLLFPDQSKQTVIVNVTYLVGSRHENYGETGMAHLLEHLTYKGS